MKINKLFLSIVIFTLAGACNSQSGDARENEEDTVVSGPIKNFIYDTLQPFREAHASTLIHLKDGSFLTAWFGGTKEGNDDVGIWLAKGRPGRWTSPKEVAKINNDAHWNPVLFQSPEGKIFLFFKVGKEIATWQTWVKTSEDNGETWSEAYELIAGDSGGRGPVRNKPIILSNGTWIAGASNENGPWNVFFDRSEDEGKTWTATPYVTIDRRILNDAVDTTSTSEVSPEGLKSTTAQSKKSGVIQPTLWESSPGQVHALLRSSFGIICRTDSKDYGKTWTPVYKTNQPNPNSAIDVTRFSDGTLVLVSNQDGRDWGARRTLALSVSNDNGVTWKKAYELENGVEGDEFSYPAIINFGDTMAITYTWKRKNIVFSEETKQWLLSHVDSSVK